MFSMNRVVAGALVPALMWAMATTPAQAQTLPNLFLSFYGRDVIQQHQGNKYFPIGKQTTFEINSHRLIRNAPGHTATVTFTVPSWLDISLLSHQDARIVLHEGVPQADGLTKTYQVDLTNGFNGAMRFEAITGPVEAFETKTFTIGLTIQDDQGTKQWQSSVYHLQEWLDLSVTSVWKVNSGTTSERNLTVTRGDSVGVELTLETVDHGYISPNHEHALRLSVPKAFSLLSTPADHNQWRCALKPNPNLPETHQELACTFRSLATPLLPDEEPLSAYHQNTLVHLGIADTASIAEDHATYAIWGIATHTQRLPRPDAATYQPPMAEPDPMDPSLAIESYADVDESNDLYGEVLHVTYEGEIAQGPSPQAPQAPVPAPVAPPTAARPEYSGIRPVELPPTPAQPAKPAPVRTQRDHTVNNPEQRATVWAQATIPQGKSVDTVLIGRNNVFADSLASGGLQGMLNAPLLLNDVHALGADTKANLAELQPKQVILLGGIHALAPNVEEELRTLGYTVRRVAGDTRIETAIAAAEAHASQATEAIIARAYDDAGGSGTQAFVDTLGGGVFAAHNEQPLLLTESKQLSRSLRDYLSRSTIRKVTVLGGEDAIAPAVIGELEALGIHVTRISGRNRAETAIKIAQHQGYWHAGEASSVMLVDADSETAWTDAFPAALYAKTYAMPLLLSNSKTTSPETRDWLLPGRIKPLPTRIICGYSVTDLRACTHFPVDSR